MKCIAVIMADLERSPLGTRSRLAEELAGEPIVRRTLRRLLGVPSLGGVHVIAAPQQVARVQTLLGGLAVQVEADVWGPPPYAALVRAGRWWGLDGWRGGIGATCVFDEDIHVVAAAAVARREKADAALCVPAAAAVLDPALLEGMLAHHRENPDLVRMTIVQAPPGLGGLVLGTDLLGELAEAAQPPGFVLTYHPDRPFADLAGKEACYRVAAEIVAAPGRMIADTTRSTRRLAELLAHGGDEWDAARIARWMEARRLEHVEAVPEEIEIELTTDDPLLAGTLLRPRGADVPRRGPVSLEVIGHVAGAIGGFDDVRVVLGGFGDPCLHPQLGAICRRLRDAGAAAIAVRTSGLYGDDALDDVLFGGAVDVIEVTLDAATPETYRAAHGADGFGRATTRLERWLALRTERRQVTPLVFPSMVKADVTVGDLEAFFDTWHRRLGMLLVTGYSHCAGQRPRRAVTEMAPFTRRPCRRVLSRTIVLADGTVTTCDQDYAGRQALGNLSEQPLADLWQSERLRAIRAHQLSSAPLCAACDEWHRP